MITTLALCEYFRSEMCPEKHFTARVRSTREGNVLTLSVHQGEGGGGTLLTGSWSLVPGPFQGEGEGVGYPAHWFQVSGPRSFPGSRVGSRYPCSDPGQRGWGREGGKGTLVRTRPPPPGKNQERVGEGVP